MGTAPCCNVIRTSFKELVSRCLRKRKLFRSTFNVRKRWKGQTQNHPNLIRLNPIPLRIETHLDEMTLNFNLCEIVRSTFMPNIASTTIRHPCDKQLVLKVFPFDTDTRLEKQTAATTRCGTVRAQKGEKKTTNENNSDMLECKIACI